MKLLKYNIKRILKNSNLAYKHLINWNSILTGENKFLYKQFQKKLNKENNNSKSFVFFTSLRVFDIAVPGSTTACPIKIVSFFLSR